MSDHQHPIDEEQAVLSFEHRDDSDQDVDMTPMIDCVFLLLIFFLVTASFQLQKSLEVPPPEQKSPNAQMQESDLEDPDTIIVRIDEDNSIWVNDSLAPSEQDLFLKLREARENAPTPDGRPASTLLVLADGEARHEVVVMVLDAGSHVEMEKVKLASAEDFEM
ncbi:MAG: biopolymer transporter ExbD [Pirellulales bacterium]|nr:biopolymer transporter ExbD [Pirellulales bacterium]